jgi:hypothetical protein
MREVEDQPRDVADVVARLTEVNDALPASDGVACFNRMYLQVTELVGQRMSAGYFADPAGMNAVDVTFAGLYLAAVDAPPGTVPKAWAPLFARRGDARLLAIQFAVAGMNTHINHDLPVAVVTTCAQRGTTPEQVHADYLRVNALLAAIEEQVRQSYLSGIALDVDRDASPVLDHLGNWSIEAARDAAWVAAETLWHLRHVGPLRDAFLDTLAGNVGLVTATLLAPL